MSGAQSEEPGRSRRELRPDVAQGLQFEPADAAKVLVDGQGAVKSMYSTEIKKIAKSNACCAAQGHHRRQRQAQKDLACGSVQYSLVLLQPSQPASDPARANFVFSHRRR